MVKSAGRRPENESRRSSRDPAALARARDERRLDLVRAAYDVITTEGFEGLRTRSVAQRGGVNIATLHYYFPTKEALIEALAEYLVSLFINEHAPAVVSSSSPAVDRLHQEFADARFYRLERPDIFSVIQELLLRAQRDPAIRSIIAPLIYHWRTDFQQLIEDGIKEGVFRPDLVPIVASALITSTVMGAISSNVEAQVLDGIFGELERWLAAPPKNIEERKL